MSRHDDLVRLYHMRDYAREALQIVAHRTREDLGTDRMFQLALTRLIEIVGEAANRVSPDGQAAHPSIPWAKITGMRHRIVHGYDLVDNDILWKTTIEDLPPLIAALDEAIARIETARKT